MPVNMSDVYNYLPHHSYWKTRYLLAQCRLTGAYVPGLIDCTNQEPLMSVEAWSEWYDRIVPDEATPKDIALLHEEKLEELGGKKE